MTEIWLPAPGVPHYKVSSHGRVWSHGTGRTKPGPIHGTITKSGYVQLQPFCSGTTLLLHRLVCEAFHGPAPEGMRLVRHLDGNKRNNRADNLAWGTDLDNHLDSVRHGVLKAPPVRRRFQDHQVIAMREAVRTGEVTCGELARRHGVAPQSISAITRGGRYQHVPVI